MQRLGHIGLALLFTAPLSIVAGLTGGRISMMIIYAPSLMMALVPDNDVWIPFIRHRGITHTLVLGIPQAVVIGAVFGSIAASAPETTSISILLGVLAATVGFLSHLVGDALTVGSGKYGIKPLWPFSRWEFRIGVTRSKSILWNQGLLFIGVGALLAAISVVQSVTTP
jgi:inner membrane protein